MTDSDEMLALADEVAAGARDGEQVEVVVATERETEVVVHGGDLESLTVADSASIGVRVISGRRQGISWAGTLDADAAREVLADARDNARFASEDPHAGLAEPDGVSPAAVRSHSDRLSSTDTDRKVDLALELERRTRAADRRVGGVESAEYGDSETRAAIVSTTGVRAVATETSCWLSVVALAGEAGETQTGFGFSLGREPGELDPDRAGGEAAGRATRMLGAIQPPSGATTVVMDPWVCAQLLEVIGGTLTADALQRGRSPFAGRLGQAVASPQVTLADDPTDPVAFTASAHDAEGLACRHNELIAGGDLKLFLHNSYTARVDGVSSTGSAVRGDVRSSPSVGPQALRLVPGQRSTAEIISGLDDVVLITDVAGLHSGVNPVSGDFSVGAEGMAVRGGEIAEPLREFTIASTLQRLLTSIVEVSSEQMVMPMGALGSGLVIDGVMISGR